MALTVRPFHPESVTKPSALEDFVLPRAFTDGSPIDLEIGCGVGWHPIKYAKAHPERRLIAIEHTKEKFESFARRFERNGKLENLLPIHANAVYWVTHALKQAQLDHALFLFPNPEPKAPNKRWFRAPFFERLLWSLKPGGTITLATNVESYMEEAVEYARAFWNLDLRERRSFTHETAPAGIPRTHFEKKYLLRGETCYDAVFAKRKTK